VESLGKLPDRFLDEIAGQPDALRRAAASVGDQLGALSRLASSHEPGRTVTFTGMGASLAACHVPVTMLADDGIRADRVDAAELLHFRQRALRRGDLLVMVSQSGLSAEPVALTKSLAPASKRPFLVAVTNGRDNSLAEAADVALDIAAGEEHGPSTMTFAATLAVLAVVSAVLGGMPRSRAVRLVREEAEGAARAAERMLARGEELGDRLQTWFGDRPAVMVLGRGVGVAAAEAGSLLLKEAARVPAEPLGSGQFRHGPLELAGPDLAVALVATERRTVDLDMRLAAELVDVGVSVLVICEPGDRAPDRATVVPVEPTGRALSAAVTALPLQLLAWRLALRRGLAPGSLVIATKVTTHE
jgi:glucosamine--fructose-6-phosphate aminotransferase (isomerizing)